MSVINHFLSRSPTFTKPFLTNIGCSSIIQMRFRRKRKPNEKMEKPEDKSTVVLGKVGRTLEATVQGVSDKQYPVLMKWNKPQLIETCNPSISGDIGGLEHFGEVDITQPPLRLQGSRELESSEDVVKRILSLEYGRNREVMDVLKRGVVRSVQRHVLDEDSLEVKIARLTVKIRNYQRDLINRFPYKNQQIKHDLTFKIALRRKLIELLREQDYRKYEWLLEKLNLFYKPVPHYDHLEISRRASIERLTDMWCHELKKHRLQKYQRTLQEEQPKFLRSKAEKLRHIMAEEIDLGLEPTVFQADIEECLSRADHIERDNVELVTQSENYLVYTEEAAKQQNFLN